MANALRKEHGVGRRRAYSTARCDGGLSRFLGSTAPAVAYFDPKARALLEAAGVKV
jgi:hypothetical protein